MSNVLAAIGRSQMRVLADRVERRRANFERYREALRDIPGISWMPEAPYGASTRWLSVAMIDPAAFGATPEDLRRELEARDIESRPVWKPLHLQPLYRGCRTVGGNVAERLFASGLCLPSGSQMTAADIERVVEGVLHTREARFRRGRTTRRRAG